MTTYSSDSQGKFIPASQRPDGTWRKARRVKDGYVPQEEVPLYESKGKIFSQKPKYPVGFCPEVIEKEKQKEQQRQQKLKNPIPGLIINPDLNKEKKPKIKQNDMKSDRTNKAEKKPISTKPGKEKQNQEEENAAVNDLAQQLSDNVNVDPTVELSKKLKRLRKKLRDTEMLQEKIASGEIQNPERDQLEKIERKPQLLLEIQSLEEQRKKIHESRDK